MDDGVHAVHGTSGRGGTPGRVRVQGSDTRGREGAVVLVQGRGQVHAGGGGERREAGPPNHQGGGRFAEREEVSRFTEREAADLEELGDAAAGESSTRNRQPRNPKPEARSLKPETRNPAPETRSPKPETRNPKPGTRNPKPEARNPKNENRSPKPETRGANPNTQKQFALCSDCAPRIGDSFASCPVQPPPHERESGKGAHTKIRVERPNTNVDPAST